MSKSSTNPKADAEEPIHIRTARTEEAAAIAALHYAIRNSTYAGILPASVLAADSLDRRIALWEARLTDRARRIFVAVNREGIVALACAAPMPARPQGREPLPGFDAYLESLYVDPVVQGKGIGAALLRHIATTLRADGFTSLALHTLARNRARSFYEHLGARFIRNDRSEELGEHWDNAAYGWADIAALCRVP